MKKLESTLPSSAQVDTELPALSPGARAWLYARDDELQRRRASDQARGAATPQSNRQRSMRPVIREIAARVAATGVMSREKIAEAVLVFIETQGAGACGLPRVPSLETIRRALREKS